LKCLKGEADEKELEQAFTWVHSSHANLEYYKLIRDAWISAGIISSKSNFDCDKAWHRVARRTGMRKLNFTSMYSGWQKTAAVFIIALIIGAIGYKVIFDRNFLLSEREFLVQVPYGAKTYMVLPDSSKVWLNAGSTLRYSSHYDVTGRTVYLSGEAYFDVESGNKLPFRVHTADLVINALGTEFNVQAYPDDDYVKTTLVSGLVSLERTGHKNDVGKILLRPNQTALLSRNQASFKIQNLDAIAKEDEINNGHDIPVGNISIKKVVNTDLYTSWKDKRLIFDGERMTDLAVKLERIYDVKIIFKDEDLKHYRLTGSLEEETLEQLLSAIRLTIPLDFKIEKNEVVLALNRKLQEEYKNISTE
jgi:transmembrane sensor